MPTILINDATAALEATSADFQTFFLTDNASRGRVTLSHYSTELINYGTVFDNVGGDAVAMTRNAFLENMAGGTIGGDASGVTINSPEATFINNHGVIVGEANHGINVVGTTGETVTISNTGMIHGQSHGIHIESVAGTSHSIQNSGAIRGDYGVSFDVFGGRLTVTNSGRMDRISIEDGGLTFINTGMLTGNIGGGSDADFITNNGTITGQISLDNGNDTYKGTGRATTVFGGIGNDTLIGSAFADELVGEGDNDKLTGGLGKDELWGGDGNDTFIFSAKTHSRVGAQADVIMDFDDGGDTGDRIDVSSLFGPRMTYIHIAKFTAAGQVRINDIAGPDLIVEVNTGGSLAPDFAIRLAGTSRASMNGGDFIL